MHTDNNRTALPAESLDLCLSVFIRGFNLMVFCNPLGSVSLWRICWLLGNHALQEGIDRGPRFLLELPDLVDLLGREHWPDLARELGAQDGRIPDGLAQLAGGR